MDDTLKQPEVSRLIIYYKWFLRTIALYCLICGVVYWVRIIGIYDVRLWRFDLMPWQWQCLSVILAVSYPVIASGLWMGSRWGIILWLIAGVSESITMTFYATHFSWNPLIACVQTAFVMIFAYFNIKIFNEKHKKAEMTVQY